ncbi:MAG: SufD family Fe-S cluster assembly protein [Eubacteriales bacterium]|nr:SufD family Fe-S cluster assembly protein [Eubacteriales bacterium]
MNQEMDMKINHLPAKTWNWLRMNVSEVKQVRAEKEAACREELPAQITAKTLSREEADRTLRTVKTGMGPDMDLLAEKSGFGIRSFETLPGAETEPLYLSYSYENGDRALNLVDLAARRDSRMTVIMDYSSDQKAEGLCAVRTRLLAEENALLRLVQIDRLGSGMLCLNDVGAWCGENARIEIVHIFLGGGAVYQGCRTELSGNGSSLQADIGYLLEGSQRLDMNYNAVHLGKKTDSETNASGVLKGEAFKLFRGTIDFQKGSAEAVGAEKEDVLLLDDGVVNQTIPLILCAEEDVKGSHGASIGQLDEEALFYMQARGLSEEAVYALMARARIEAVCQKIPDERTRRLVRERLGGEAEDECE